MCGADGGLRSFESDSVIARPFAHKLLVGRYVGVPSCAIALTHRRGLRGELALHFPYAYDGRPRIAPLVFADFRRPSFVIGRTAASDAWTGATSSFTSLTSSSYRGLAFDYQT